LRILSFENIAIKWKSLRKRKQRCQTTLQMKLSKNSSDKSVKGSQHGVRVWASSTQKLTTLGSLKVD
jgi:hypothetical protein